MAVTKNEILQIIRKHKAQLSEKYPLRNIALFGSFAREEQTEDSDIDIMVDFYSPVGMEIVDLAIELEEMLHFRVDIVTYNAVKERLYDYIKSDLIYV